jgi:hypothetical protein
VVRLRAATGALEWFLKVQRNWKSRVRTKNLGGESDLSLRTWAAGFQEVVYYVRNRSKTLNVRGMRVRRTGRLTGPNNTSLGWLSLVWRFLFVLECLSAATCWERWKDGSRYEISRTWHSA